MTTQHDRPRPAGPRESGRCAESFLVRTWREPGEGDGAAGPLRCFVRNLRTGEEEYLPRLDAVASSLARSLAAGSGPSDVAEQGFA